MYMSNIVILCEKNFKKCVFIAILWNALISIQPKKPPQPNAKSLFPNRCGSVKQIYFRNSSLHSSTVQINADKDSFERQKDSTMRNRMVKKKNGFWSQKQRWPKRSLSSVFQTTSCCYVWLKSSKAFQKSNMSVEHATTCGSGEQTEGQGGRGWMCSASVASLNPTTVSCKLILIWKG